MLKHSYKDGDKYIYKGIPCFISSRFSNKLLILRALSDNDKVYLAYPQELYPYLESNKDGKYMLERLED
jgi:hypothetical protein